MDLSKIPDTLTVSEAFRLKHQLNKEITYAGTNLNAVEITEMASVGDEEWERIRKEYNEYYRDGHGSIFVKSVHGAPVYGFLAIGVGLFLLFLLSGWWRTAGGLLVFFAVYQFAKAEGHWSGYYDGYTDCRADTVHHKLLNLSEDQLKDLHARAREMQADQMVIDQMDQKEK